MKIASITAGAAGMICGSCMRDNALAGALNRLGHDANLIPTFTPIRTDEVDFSNSRIFVGGINVYLAAKADWLGKLPRWLRRTLDSRLLLGAISRFSPPSNYSKLGPLTLTMLRGEQGPQRREFDDLVNWLANDVKPEIVVLSNVLLSGLAPELKNRLKVPILATLQGDDIFLEGLPSSDRKQAIQQIGTNCKSIAGFIATSEYYAEHMARYLGLPRTAIQVVPPGVNLDGYDMLPLERNRPPFHIGFFARMAPEKGLHVLAEAYARLRRMHGCPPCRLRVSGWHGPQHDEYLKRVRSILDAEKLLDEFDHVESPTHADKVRFLQSLDLFSVPAVYGEPKAMYVLESLAAGVPVILPRNGAFTELVTATGGGVLVDREDPDALARALLKLIQNEPQRKQLAEQGRKVVGERYSSEVMAKNMLAVFSQYTSSPQAVSS